MKVPADKSRAHLNWLSCRGIGRDSVRDITGLNDDNLKKIRQGKRATVFAETEKKILSVTPKGYAGATVISSEETWKMLNRLLQGGFTRSELALRMGYKTPKLHFGREAVTGATEARVRRFYEKVMAE